jgi:hypothetical protein
MMSASDPACGGRGKLRMQGESDRDDPEKPAAPPTPLDEPPPVPVKDPPPAPEPKGPYTVRTATRRESIRG